MKRSTVAAMLIPSTLKETPPPQIVESTIMTTCKKPLTYTLSMYCCYDNI
jgi:hypothetical protein